MQQTAPTEAWREKFERERAEEKIGQLNAEIRERLSELAGQ